MFKLIPIISRYDRSLVFDYYATYSYKFSETIVIMFFALLSQLAKLPGLNNVWLGVYDYLSGHEMTTQSKDYKKLHL